MPIQKPQPQPFDRQSSDGKDRKADGSRRPNEAILPPSDFFSKPSIFFLLLTGFF
jgi:hypothetical protein